MASSQYDILLCSETLVSDMRDVSELLVPTKTSNTGRPVLRDQFRLPCLVVQGQDASGRRDGCMPTRLLRSISPTQILVWLLRIAGFYGVWCETEPLCVVFTATLT